MLNLTSLVLPIQMRIGIIWSPAPMPVVNDCAQSLVFPSFIAGSLHRDRMGCKGCIYSKVCIHFETDRLASPLVIYV